MNSKMQLAKFLLNLNVRSISDSLHANFLTKSRLASSISNSTVAPGKVVFISQSTDAFANLAFEDWLYQNWSFDKRYVLLLWRNSPCVVIGRHQNPYTEANLSYLESAGVPVIRRNSGGGAVYHDDGNLNCTFFSPKSKYNRRWNLELISKALKTDFNIDSKINSKDDITIGNDLKISGTAAKLGGNSAYHHCTILVSSDKMQLKLALQGDKTLQSKATSSVPSSTANLQEICQNLSVEKLIASIGRSFLESSLPVLEANQNSLSNYIQSDGFTLINPSEEWFPGIEASKAKLKSWEWLYGMTPLFKVTRPIALEDKLSEGSSVLISLDVYHGIVNSVTTKSRVSSILKDLIENHIGSKLKGSRYSADTFSEIENQLLMEKDMIPRYSSI